VTIVDQPYKLGWLGDDLYLEVHIDKEEKRQSPRSVIPESVASAEGLEIDWKRWSGRCRKTPASHTWWEAGAAQPIGFTWT
jgi:hypothetical protein